MIGPVVLTTDFGDVVGYENHSGSTTLGAGQAAFGTVRSGLGNNGTDGTEGARTGNVFGSYLHGPILPANPQFADALIGAGGRTRHRADRSSRQPRTTPSPTRRAPARSAGSSSAEPVQPPPEVLDLFAVPDHVTPLSGGQGRSFVAGDLVLSPGRDAATSTWLNPVLARLAVELDTTTPRTLRIAMPIPSRDGRWVVDGWGASRYEPHSHHCRELDVLVATGRLLHARLASALPVTA